MQLKIANNNSDFVPVFVHIYDERINSDNQLRHEIVSANIQHMFEFSLSAKSSMWEFAKEQLLTFLDLVFHVFFVFKMHVLFVV